MRSLRMWCVPALLLGLLGAACTQLPPSKARAADVYAAIIAAIVADHPPISAEEPVPPRVFVEPLGEGTAISIDVQSDLVGRVADVAAVRFIDSRDEALETNEDGKVVVRDDGLLLGLGPVPNDASDLEVGVSEYVGTTTVRMHSFTLRSKEDGWAITAHTSQLEQITPDA